MTVVLFPKPGRDFTKTKSCRPINLIPNQVLERMGRVEMGRKGRKWT